ncbi:MAG: LapA family protein, partial [Cyanobacteria bacterium P01_H01_bin.130]
LELLPGLELEAPLSLELLLAMGVGAVLAWTIGLWGGVQNLVARFKSSRELKQRDQKIEELEAALNQMRGQLEQQQQQQQSMVAIGEAQTDAIAELPEGNGIKDADIQDAEFEPSQPGATETGEAAP